VVKNCNDLDLAPLHWLPNNFSLPFTVHTSFATATLVILIPYFVSINHTPQGYLLVAGIHH